MTLQHLAKDVLVLCAAIGIPVIAAGLLTLVVHASTKGKNGRS